MSEGTIYILLMIKMIKLSSKPMQSLTVTLAANLKRVLGYLSILYLLLSCLTSQKSEILHKNPFIKVKWNRMWW